MTGLSVSGKRECLICLTVSTQISVEDDRTARENYGSSLHPRTLNASRGSDCNRWPI